MTSTVPPSRQATSLDLLEESRWSNGPRGTAARTHCPPHWAIVACSGSSSSAVVAALGEHVGAQPFEGGARGVLVELDDGVDALERAEHGGPVGSPTIGRAGPLRRRTEASELSSTTRQSPSRRAGSSMRTCPRCAGGRSSRRSPRRCRRPPRTLDAPMSTAVDACSHRRPVDLASGSAHGAPAGHVVARRGDRRGARLGRECAVGERAGKRCGEAVAGAARVTGSRDSPAPSSAGCHPARAARLGRRA